MFYSLVSSFYSSFNPTERETSISSLLEYQESDQILLDWEENLSCQNVQPSKNG
jgi:hypothetical protein